MLKCAIPSLLILPLVGGGLVGGCAHRPPEPVAEPQVDRIRMQTQELDQTPVAPVGESAPPQPIQQGVAIHPDKDPRYALPQAQSRSLTIFLETQTFEWVEDDRVVASGSISSGSAQHPTPTGSFRVLSKDRDKRSGSYTNYFNQNTPMPYSLQFYGPYFIHEGWLPGYADSHGCVRLSYEDARLLFSRVKVGDPVRVVGRGGARAQSPLGEQYPVF